MKLKLVSDGTCMGTQLVNAETGEPVEHVYSLEWGVNAKTQLCSAVIVINDLSAEIEIEDPAVLHRNPANVDPSWSGTEG